MWRAQVPLWQHTSMPNTVVDLEYCPPPPWGDMGACTNVQHVPVTPGVCIRLGLLRKPRAPTMLCTEHHTHHAAHAARPPHRCRHWA